ncbi:MAG: hypothetical protein ACU843_13060 [Gammaproteobacteria bacterium]
MQCYERQAMYLMLNTDAVLASPHLQFDPVLLDEVLSEFSINNFKALTEMDAEQKREVIKHIKAIT